MFPFECPTLCSPKETIKIKLTKTFVAPSTKTGKRADWQPNPMGFLSKADSFTVLIFPWIPGSGSKPRRNCQRSATCDTLAGFVSAVPQEAPVEFILLTGPDQLGLVCRSQRHLLRTSDRKVHCNTVRSSGHNARVAGRTCWRISCLYPHTAEWFDVTSWLLLRLFVYWRLVSSFGKHYRHQLVRSVDQITSSKIRLITIIIINLYAIIHTTRS